MGEYPYHRCWGDLGQEGYRHHVESWSEWGANGDSFLGTKECDAKAYADLLPALKKEDILLIKSPVGYPARAINTGVIKRIEEGNAPKIACVSNCVAPCNRGEEAKKVGYCIADGLGRSYLGNREEGLYFTGANGYRVDKIISVHELIKELTEG